jgi:methylated-DNA-protein-cysteine methyltransferase related protein
MPDSALPDGSVFTRCMDMELAHRMLDVVARIPAGAVATYGDVAAMAGSRSPRLAGFVLAHLSDDDTPWHRVLRANGTPAPHLAQEQLGRLRSEGVVAIDGKVDLRRYRWHE